MSYKKARTERDKIKLMTYIQYIQQCYKEKKQNHNKKKLMCVNYATVLRHSKPDIELLYCRILIIIHLPLNNLEF